MSDYYSEGILTNEFITVVSGLPRSGTSMMMKMLQAGNMPLLIDDMRIPDEDNPRGYFEFERVKDLEHDNSWLDIARGRAVKIVSPLLRYVSMDAGYRYRIIFMLRNVNEILMSQRKMASRLNPGEDGIEDALLMKNYSVHLKEIQEWANRQENMDVMYLQYADVLMNPLAAARHICNFLGLGLNTREMSAVIDGSLYRQRANKPGGNHNAVPAEEDSESEIIAERLRHLGYL
jgi:hypothetical protein